MLLLAVADQTLRAVDRIQRNLACHIVNTYAKAQRRA
jgi:hypothetical protein